MATSYGNTVQHWRGYSVADVSTKDNSHMNVRVRVYMQSRSWRYLINSGISARFSSAGGNGSGGGGFSNNGDVTVAKCYIDKTVTLPRKKDAYNTTISWSVRNSSGYHNGTSSGKISISIPAVPSHKLTFNLNHGSGNFPQMIKYWGYNLYLPTNTPTRTNYSFVDWIAGGTHYKPGDRYLPDVDTTFIAQWHLNHKRPALGSVVVERCRVDGTADEEGTFAKVTAAWEVVDSDYADGTGTITIAYAKQSANNYSSFETFDVSDGSSGEATIIFGRGNLAVSDAWDIKVTFHDGTLSVSKVAIITRPFIPLEIAAQGAAVSFGAHLPRGAQSGVWVRGRPLLIKDGDSVAYDNGGGTITPFMGVPVVLFDDWNAKPENTVTLSDSIANYSYVFIYWNLPDAGNQMGGQIVYKPNGRKISIGHTLIASNLKLYGRHRFIVFQGNKIKTYSDANGGWYGEQNTGGILRIARIAIVRVVGYK